MKMVLINLLEYIKPPYLNVVDSLLWHMCLGHPEKEKLNRIVKMGFLPKLTRVNY